jgi:hypothetical protein
MTLGSQQMNFVETQSVHSNYAVEKQNGKDIFKTGLPGYIAKLKRMVHKNRTSVLSHVHKHL